MPVPGVGASEGPRDAVQVQPGANDGILVHIIIIIVADKPKGTYGAQKQANVNSTRPKMRSQSRRIRREITNNQAGRQDYGLPPHKMWFFDVWNGLNDFEPSKGRAESPEHDSPGRRPG